MQNYEQQSKFHVAKKESSICSQNGLKMVSMIQNSSTSLFWTISTMLIVLLKETPGAEMFILMSPMTCVANADLSTNLDVNTTSHWINYYKNFTKYFHQGFQELSTKN